MAPLRRLTRFEYNNTVRDLLGDTTSPASALPSEVLGNGFGNDAATQSVSSLLVEQYSVVAEAVALRATETSERLAQLAPCAGSISETTDPQTVDACARTLIGDFATRAFRRPLEATELDELVQLYGDIRAGASFPSSIAAVIEAILISPDFLYRVEFGRSDGGIRRPSGHEMATRLSYFLWGTTPDAELMAAAERGELSTKEGVYAQAERLLEDSRARGVVRFFFDNFLPISALSQLERDRERYPTFSAQIGSYMREETQRFLEHVLFEGEGSWPAALTADYTFVNGPLAEFYGISGVTGDAFQRVELDVTQRLGVLTHAGVLAGRIHSNETNPVSRGMFIAEKQMCFHIPFPTNLGDQIVPPDPYSGATARERFSAHSENPECATCHKLIDPIGFALENFDAVGLWRDTENEVVIDATGKVPGVDEPVDGPVELVQRVAASEATQKCFASHWLNFAYGRTLGPADSCIQAQAERAFAEAGYDFRALLLALTQTDAFLYLPPKEAP
jgi:hypothetical protein